MTDSSARTPTRWCIVVTDALAPDWPVGGETDAQSAPVQFCGIGEPTTMLQKALHRARRISHANRILVTGAEVHRAHWQPALWFTRTEHRFVSESPGWSSLTTAAAVLSIAARDPSAAVTILPARSYVADEWTLTVALHTALTKMSSVGDGVVTLGMESGGSEVEEDYLMLRDQPERRLMIPVSGTARRPLDWVAQHLVARGALVASGIYVGRAEVLVARLYKYWPKLTHQLARNLTRAFAAGVENRLAPDLVDEALRTAPQSFWKHPPWMPLRALRVASCGWSSLRSGHAIERIAAPQHDAPSVKALPSTAHDAQPRRRSGPP
jgi:mannose-1-phosphate guanylyltransferase